MDHFRDLTKMVYINSLGSSPGLRLGYRFRYRPLDTLLSRVFTHCLCFSFQEFVFSLCHFSVSFSEIASEFTVGANDPMAGDFGCEEVFFRAWPMACGLRQLMLFTELRRLSPARPNCALRLMKLLRIWRYDIRCHQNGRI